MPPARHDISVGQGRPLLLAHGPRRVPAHSLAGLAIEEGQHLGVAQHVALHCQVLALVLQVPCQEAVEITLAEGGVIASARSTASEPGVRIRIGPTCSCGTAPGASTRSSSPCSAK
jgi:hypothetical protein